MTLTPEVVLWIIGGLITACWALLMWRLGMQDKTLDKLDAKLDNHAKEDKEAFRELFQILRERGH